MLSLLRIRNLAIVDEVEFEFGSGVNVLTGETGAGKSIVLNAIELLTGKRSSADIVRAGSEACEVEGFFVLSDKAMQALSEVNEEIAESVVDNELLIRRIVSKQGRSKAYINSQLTTLGVLEHIGPVLLDITGQRYAHTLLEPNAQRDLLDDFGVPKPLREEVSNAYQAYATAAAARDNFKKESDVKSDYFRRLAFERDELVEAQIKGDEREQLEADLKRLGSVERLQSIASEVIAIIDEEPAGVDAGLSHIQVLIAEATKADSALTEVSELFNSAAVQLSEARLQLLDKITSIDADPERLEQTRERIADIARLERKYGKTEPQLLEYCETIQAELIEFESGDFTIEKLDQRVQVLEAALRSLEEDLRKKRKTVAGKLKKLVQKELAQLGMPKALFDVSIEAASSGPKGADKVEFLFMANPGDSAKPLAKVASGGEFARVVLILKTLLNEQSHPDLQIFDEIDVGVGGAIAQVVGEKLRAVGKVSQVVLVTHAPQVAALADTHFYISKTASKNSTRTTIAELSEAERVQEIARMLAGKKVTTQFENSAKELLSQRNEH